MYFILEILFDALALLLLARVMPGVQVRSFGTALGVVIVIGLLNATVGALLRFPLNLVTLFLLGFIVRLVVTAVMIRLADYFFRGFEVRNFTTALLLAIALALAASLFSVLFRTA